MRRQLLPALRIFLVLTVALGLLYPLSIFVIGRAFSSKADGSLVRAADGTVIGSSLIGQEFSGETYFSSRPSAAGILASGSLDDQGQAADPTDATLQNSGASNLGPTNPVLIDGVAQKVIAYRVANGLADDTPVPIDAVTSSASGVDPNISVANARLQAKRVARVRGIAESTVLSLIDRYTDGAVLGVFGVPGVNVLELNLALDRS
jgi:K+-transporting ATPase ATPase C chain